MKLFLRKNKLPLLLAFLIPALVMATAFAINGIYWGSDVSPLAGDAYHQYVQIDALYSQILHSGGQQGFLYTWTSGLGLNLYAFASYYMGSFFMPLTFFFNVKDMPDALYLFTLLKFGCIGLSSYIAFRNMYQKVNRWLVLALSISFALLSFLTSQNEIPMWQDVFILVPLILWGLHQLQDKGRRLLYFVSLTILFIQNYYFGYILAIFLVLYSVARLFRRRMSWKQRGKKLIDFAITSFLSGLTSLIMLLPMYLDLKANGQSLTTVDQLLTAHSWGLDFFAKNIIGSYDTTQYNAVPMIYVGLFPLILAFVFFLIRGIRWQWKLSAGLVAAFIVASFYFQWLDLMWQGFHTPNMFLHRYAWVLSLLIVLLAFESLSRFEKVKIWQLLIVPCFLMAGFIASLLVQRYTYLNGTLLALTLLFLAAYFILLLGYQKKWIGLALFAPILILFVTVEMGVNTYYQIAGVKTQWNYASRVYYEQQAALYMPDAKAISADNTKGQLVRTDNTAPDTANDSMKYGWNSIAQFSSVRNSNSSAVMARLGFQTDGGYLNLRYPENSLLMDSIFDVAYNINSAQPNKYGFVTLPDFPANLSKNTYTQSLGIFVPGGYSDVNLSGNDELANQTAFVNALTKTNHTYFTPFFASSQSTNGNSVNNYGTVTLTKKAGATGDLVIHYTVTTPANSQCYLRMPNISYENPSNNNMTVSVGNFTYTVTTGNAGDLFNLGYYPNATTIEVTLTFPQNNFVSFNETSFWALNVDSYTQAMAQLSENPVSAKPIKNGVVLTADNSQAGDLFLTIPYDKGWSATVDGKQAPLLRAQNGFMKLRLTAGKHSITLHFWPSGLTEGIIAFVSGILLFVSYDFWKRKKHRT